ncbi:peptidoglycan-binding domain-containing protein [Streptomyces sp. 7R007]
MPTPPDSGSPHDRLPLEPIRVLRPRRTDALAELFREMEQGTAEFEPVAVADPWSWDEGETQELPPVRADDPNPPPAQGAFGFGPGLRRAAVVVAVAAAALVGFVCALLIAARHDGTTARTPAASATASAAPAPTTAAAGPADPDGAGTLREGDSGPEVSAMQQRLLQIPDVYQNGSTDGHYDATLKEAVARFQLWYGIRGDETGVYGNDTRQALESRTTSGTG